MSLSLLECDLAECLGLSFFSRDLSLDSGECLGVAGFWSDGDR